MDNLDSLYRKFQRIAGKPGASWDNSTWRAMRTWLQNDVMPAIHGLATLQSFREHAGWPLKNLTGSSASEIRSLLEETDRSIVDAAERLKPLLQIVPPPNAVEFKPNDQLVLIEEASIEMIDGKASVQTVRNNREWIVGLQHSCSTIHSIAKRFWRDLASNLDYFEPRAGWNTVDRHPLQWGEFILSLNPELQEGGDFMSRCVVRRVELLVEMIECGHRDLRHTMKEEEEQTSGDKFRKELEEAVESLVHARQRSRMLRSQLLQEQSQPVRNACIFLTQIGVAVDDSFDVSWLDIPEFAKTNVAMGYRLFSREIPSIYEQIAAALAGLRDTFASRDEDTTALEAAIAKGGLVILEKAQIAYWNRERINTKWQRTRKQWQLLVKLAKAGLRESPVGDDDPDLFPYVPGFSTFSMLTGRLKKNLPPDLRRRIIPGSERRSAKLELPRDLINVFA